MNFGYTLFTEEYCPRELVEFAHNAEKSGFGFVGISDHFHPWTQTQGQSPFSWPVIGAIAEATSTIGVFNEVVCSTIRYHPAIVAQAAATSQVLLEGHRLRSFVLS
jgi:coenzyme F420-dependent glucose-6-phosphate dehydrogenase